MASDVTIDYITTGYKYLSFLERYSPERKTRLWVCSNRKSGGPLGEVRWHGAWRHARMRWYWGSRLSIHRRIVWPIKWRLYYEPRIRKRAAERERKAT